MPRSGDCLDTSMTRTSVSSSPSPGQNVITNTSRTITSTAAQSTRLHATPTFTVARDRAFWAARSASFLALAQPHQPDLTQQTPLVKYPAWRDTDYGQAYLSASIEQGLAWQIRANRKAREWSQEELASRIGTQQSAVSRLEDPTYGAHSLETLTSLAHAFDCALSVKFVAYSRLAADSEDLSQEAMYAAPFSSEEYLLEPLNEHDF